MVDSGASFSLIPFGVWQKLEITPQDTVECILVDGSIVKRQVADCKLAAVGKSGVTRVILGEQSDTEALLGALTLEPFSRTLRPMRFRM